MNAREERGLVIAATCRLRRNDDGTWLVPSQTSRDVVGYIVNLKTKDCTCPDHKEGGFTCKHYFAASIVHNRDVLPDGTIIETKKVTFEERKVYKQDWPAYTRAQRTEKRRLRVLLHDLCRKLPAREQPPAKSGPKPHLPSDAVFAMTYKVYSGLSARRFGTDLEEAHEQGFLTRSIHPIKVASFFEDAYYTPLLKEMIAYQRPAAAGRGTRLRH